MQRTWDISEMHDEHFLDLLEDCIEIFMDDFTVYGDSFETFLGHLDVVLER